MNSDSAQSKDWNPEQYARFSDHRLRPALDLIQRIPSTAYDRIVDLGCGNGNVTQELRRHWPDADMTGADSSANMLDEARRREPSVTWQQADIATWQPEGEALIFSNAAFHWLDDHAGLLSRLVGGLRRGGVLAFQVPDNFDQPSHTIMRDVAADPRWQDRLAPVASRRFVAMPSEYIGWLEAGATHVEVWQTTYHQILQGPDPVFEWLKGAGMRPYLEPLEADEAAAFENACREALAVAYPARADGTTVFPFRRLFAVAIR